MKKIIYSILIGIFLCSVSYAETEDKMKTLSSELQACIAHNGALNAMINEAYLEEVKALELILNEELDKRTIPETQKTNLKATFESFMEKIMIGFNELGKTKNFDDCNKALDSIGIVGNKFLDFMINNSIPGDWSEYSLERTYCDFFEN